MSTLQIKPQAVISLIAVLFLKEHLFSKGAPFYGTSNTTILNGMALSGATVYCISTKVCDSFAKGEATEDFGAKISTPLLCMLCIYIVQLCKLDPSISRGEKMFCDVLSGLSFLGASSESGNTAPRFHSRPPEWTTKQYSDSDITKLLATPEELKRLTSVTKAFTPPAFKNENNGCAFNSILQCMLHAFKDDPKMISKFLEPVVASKDLQKMSPEYKRKHVFLSLLHHCCQDSHNSDAIRMLNLYLRAELYRHTEPNSGQITYTSYKEVPVLLPDLLKDFFGENLHKSDDDCLLRAPAAPGIEQALSVNVKNASFSKGPIYRLRADSETVCSEDDYNNMDSTTQDLFSIEDKGTNFQEGKGLTSHFFVQTVAGHIIKAELSLPFTIADLDLDSPMVIDGKRVQLESVILKSPGHYTCMTRVTSESWNHLDDLNDVIQTPLNKKAALELASGEKDLQPIILGFSLIPETAAAK